jgi:hypothetical protein
MKQPAVLETDLPNGGACKEITRRFLPLLTLCFLVNSIDRTNVGFAARSMTKDIGSPIWRWGEARSAGSSGRCWMGWLKQVTGSFSVPLSWAMISALPGTISLSRPVVVGGCPLPQQ